MMKNQQLNEILSYIGWYGFDEMQPLHFFARYKGGRVFLAYTELIVLHISDYFHVQNVP